MLAGWARWMWCWTTSFVTGMCGAAAPLTGGPKRLFASAPKTVTMLLLIGATPPATRKGLCALAVGREREGGRRDSLVLLSARMSDALHARFWKYRSRDGKHTVSRSRMWIGNAPNGIRFERGLERRGDRCATWLSGWRKRQGGLFADAAASCTLPCSAHLDWEPVKLIEWHREKAGTIERVHDVLKNELATGVLPSKSSGPTPLGCGWQ